MSDVLMPALSDSMEEGTVIRWLRKPGEMVRRGEELVEIEADKATVAYQAESDGVLEVLIAEGETVAVGAAIARLEPGATKASARAASPAAGSAAPPMSAGQEPEGAGHRTAPDGRTSGSAASPVARRIAHRAGIDLAKIRGTGPGGRITKRDVAPLTGAHSEADEQVTVPGTRGGADPASDTHVGGGRSQGEDGTQPSSDAARAGAKRADRTEELSHVQRTIAQRMSQSKATVPDFTLQLAVNMERAVSIREELKRNAWEEGEPLPSLNDFVIRAVALALREHPRANASYRDGRLELHERVNVGMAVADSETLIVPVVTDADTKSLGTIARETRASAERVRNGSITPTELSGATFTVSNLGMFGIERFLAVINPPQAAILAVGAVRPQPVARGERVVVCRQMEVSLICDHRILYGADAARFLVRVRDLLEHPLRILL